MGWSSNENANKCPTCRHELFRSDTTRANEVEWTFHVGADMAFDNDLLHNDSDNESEFDNLSVACAEQLNLSRPQVHRLMREAEQSLHDAVNLSQEQEIHPVESEGESDSLRFPPNLKDITLREHANDFTTDLLSRLRLYTATYTPSNGELYRHFERTCEAYGTDGHPTFWCNEWPQICSTLKDLRLQAARISGNSPRVRWVKRTAVPSMAGVLGRELER